MFHRIVHANDGSENAFSAFETAARLTGLCDAHLDVILIEELSPRSGTISEVHERKASEDRQLRERKRRIGEIARRHAVSVEVHTFAGHPVKRIVEFVKETGADLLVIGATEHRDFGELIFGRRSDRVTHNAICSVLIAR